MYLTEEESGSENQDGYERHGNWGHEKLPISACIDNGTSKWDTIIF